MRSARVEALRCSSGCFLGRPPGTIFPSYWPRIQGRLPWSLSKGRNPWRSHRTGGRFVDGVWSRRGAPKAPLILVDGVHGESEVAPGPVPPGKRWPHPIRRVGGSRATPCLTKHPGPVCDSRPTLSTTAAVRLTRCCVGSRSGGKPRPDGRRPPRSGVFSVRKTYLAPRFACCFAISRAHLSRGASTGHVKRSDTGPERPRLLPQVGAQSAPCAEIPRRK